MNKKKCLSNRNLLGSETENAKRKAKSDGAKHAEQRWSFLTL